MDPIYPRFAAAHPVFYELPDGHSNKRSGDGIFEPVPTHLWREWRNVHNGPWSVWSPVDSELPEQGWKVHVSALHSNAELALAATSRFCHQAGIAFKFLRSAADLERALSKDADRAGAGKFITIYPPSQQDLLNTLDTLDRELGNNDAPYILSDLRWKRGPLFVRYGAFLPLIMSENGLDIPAIRDPRTNTLVADRREAAFFIPAWVQMPDFLQQQLDARLHTTARLPARHRHIATLKCWRYLHRRD